MDGVRDRQGGVRAEGAGAGLLSSIDPVRGFIAGLWPKKLFNWSKNFIFFRLFPEVLLYFNTSLYSDFRALILLFTCLSSQWTPMAANLARRTAIWIAIARVLENFMSTHAKDLEICLAMQKSIFKS